MAVGADGLNDEGLIEETPDVNLTNFVVFATDRTIKLFLNLGNNLVQIGHFSPLRTHSVPYEYFTPDFHFCQIVINQVVFYEYVSKIRSRATY